MVKTKYILILTIIVFGLAFSAFFQAKPALAQESWVKGIIGEDLIPEGCTTARQSDKDTCGLKEFFQVGINITKLILGVTGTMALLMFVYGGIMFLTSGGNQERVTKGKTILINALIGIVIIFSAWIVVNFIIVALTEGGEDLIQLALYLKVPSQLIGTNHWKARQDKFQ